MPASATRPRGAFMSAAISAERERERRLHWEVGGVEGRASLPVAIVSTRRGVGGACVGTCSPMGKPGLCMYAEARVLYVWGSLGFVCTQKRGFCMCGAAWALYVGGSLCFVCRGKPVFRNPKP
jgi:hypothetical protein